jgi:hypothetical protein
MRTSALAIAILTAMTGAASADPWKDESGKGRWRGEYRDDYRGHYAREYKEEFRRGDCRIKRKWERGGVYKQEVKCKGRRW